ncbi:DUF551 domain-containing protein [Klebsiella pneumoniae]|uniref:DUF551 domain-containing protein n=1 Tax=Klebsiella pneumoniae TaxID=573 RepID=UPI000E2B5AAD|nr:DUF551 domain-containing protein [Klebsiella pneumoniae]MEC7314229.1 DUF551 domain-containing protein [Klebsiella pneumoniae]MEC7319291.1 DUF551 domain-containing protein [Klebsiella pneumoniae]SVO94355.1 Eaa1 [Klebsiella pneumoniae]SWH87757.1 Eaa1 [Klebsiella pneumoniae]SWS39026.1 Eaa1 [Klebsiella pneumoniae]
MSEFSRETLLNIIETDHVQCGDASVLARMALAAMESESWCLPLDYLQGHKDGLEWASQLAEANHPDTGDWLYDDPIELAKAIRKGPDMPPAQPVAYSEPVAWTDEEELRDVNVAGIGYLFGIDREANKFSDPRRQIMLYRHAQPAPVVPDGYVMVPKEPTAEMILSAMRDNETGEVAEIYELMLAAAPQSPGSEPATVPGKWFPLSERMPERGDYLVTDGCDFDVQLFNGEQFIPGFVWEDKITHWMPLPAAPQGVIHG